LIRHLNERERPREYIFDVIAPHFPVLPYDAKAGEWHARERARLIGVGAAASFADSQIAAIASTNGLIVATANERDFRAFEGVRTENWLA
jgi:tRNA(fMet)-specific endonuclease VapC